MTLKRLSLSYQLNQFCEEGGITVKELLTNFREGLNLQKFELLVEHRYNFGHRGGLFGTYLWEQDWKPSQRNWELTENWRTDFEKPYTDAKLVEMFMAGKCEWYVLLLSHAALHNEIPYTILN